MLGLAVRLQREQIGPSGQYGSRVSSKHQLDVVKWLGSRARRCKDAAIYDKLVLFLSGLDLRLLA